MTPRWTAVAALAVAAALGVLCASCNSEATVNPLPGKGGKSGKAPARVIDFGEEFEHIRIEAETAVKMDGNLCDKVKVVEDKDASGGKCIFIPDTIGTPEKGKFFSAHYKVTIKTPGLYTFWLRRFWPDACADTVGMRFDMAGKPRNLKKEALIGSDDMSKPPRWAWSPWYLNGNPRQVFLSAGEHVLEVMNREDGPKFDVILLTNDRDYVPQGLEE